MRWCHRLRSSVGHETGVAFAGVVGAGGETGIAFAGVNGPVLGGWSRALVSRVSSASVGRRALVSRVSSASVGAHVVAHSLHARRLELPGYSRGLMNPTSRDEATRPHVATVPVAPAISR